MCSSQAQGPKKDLRKERRKKDAAAATGEHPEYVFN